VRRVGKDGYDYRGRAPWRLGALDHCCRVRLARRRFLIYATVVCPNFRGDP
jgi:hypothetical protein